MVCVIGNKTVGNKPTKETIAGAGNQIGTSKTLTSPGKLLLSNSAIYTVTESGTKNVGTKYIQAIAGGGEDKGNKVGITAELNGQNGTGSLLEYENNSDEEVLQRWENHLTATQIFPKPSTSQNQASNVSTPISQQLNINAAPRQSHGGTIDNRDNAQNVLLNKRPEGLEADVQMQQAPTSTEMAPEDANGNGGKTYNSNQRTGNQIWINRSFVHVMKNNEQNPNAGAGWSKAINQSKKLEKIDLAKDDMQFIIPVEAGSNEYESLVVGHFFGGSFGFLFVRNYLLKHRKLRDFCRVLWNHTWTCLDASELW